MNNPTKNHKPKMPKFHEFQTIRLKYFKKSQKKKLKNSNSNPKKTQLQPDKEGNQVIIKYPFPPWKSNAGPLKLLAMRSDRRRGGMRGPVVGKAADERRRCSHVDLTGLAGITACVGLVTEITCNISLRRRRRTSWVFGNLGSLIANACLGKLALIPIQQLSLAAFLASRKLSITSSHGYVLKPLFFFKSKLF